MTALLTPVGGGVGKTLPPTGSNVAGDPDTAAGVYGIDGPDACDCSAMPGPHTEDQCVPDVGQDRATAVCSDDRWTCPRCDGTWVRDDGQSQTTWLTNLRRVQSAHGRRCSRRESLR